MEQELNPIFFVQRIETSNFVSRPDWKDRISYLIFIIPCCQANWFFNQCYFTSSSKMSLVLIYVAIEKTTIYKCIDEVDCESWDQHKRWWVQTFTKFPKNKVIYSRRKCSTPVKKSSNLNKKEHEIIFYYDQYTV